MRVAFLAPSLPHFDFLLPREPLARNGSSGVSSGGVSALERVPPEVLTQLLALNPVLAEVPAEVLAQVSNVVLVAVITGFLPQVTIDE